MVETRGSVAACKYIFRFSEGKAGMEDILGGKGANLSEMANLGLPVPPGFIVTTEACLKYYSLAKKMPFGLWDDILKHVGHLEKDVGKGFGDSQNPLLLSVRSGARVSMPGMMDTILNLGINDENVEGLAKVMGDRRPALDAYRRFLQIFGNVAMNVPLKYFEDFLKETKIVAGVRMDHQLDQKHLESVILGYKGIIEAHAGRPVPSKAIDQLKQAVLAVFESWNNPRAIEYRNHMRFSHDLGTAVNIMVMVFGNTGPDSGTGVLFTRDPASGSPGIYGEYLPNAQGEDVVAGLRTPSPISSLSITKPFLYTELESLAKLLETHYKDVQDVEFTIENERLFLLQTRSAQRTTLAAIRIAVDLVAEGIITKDEALLRIDPEDLTKLFMPRFNVKSRNHAVAMDRLLTKGAPASPGAATGRVCFEVVEACRAAQLGEDVILVRPQTSPDDIGGVLVAKGVLTSRGGTTSHAAVVTRGLGKPCIVGAEQLEFDKSGEYFSVNGQVVKNGETISMDGTTGEIFLGRIETVDPDLEDLDEAGLFLSWADDRRELGVWANADTGEDAIKALDMGAEGIGLCRTEHMFLGSERVNVVQQVLLNAAETEKWQLQNPEISLTYVKGSMPADLPASVRIFCSGLAELEALQVADFENILRVMEGRPVIIRLMDAPLHEFLPNYEKLVGEIAELRVTKGSSDILKERESLLDLLERSRESNPMLGHRGCRLGLTFPSIYEMQVKAIITACCKLLDERIKVSPEIMIPLTSHVNEFATLKNVLTKVADKVQKEKGHKFSYKFGTMIEVPRACLTADAIGELADFFSFGTNDLTQTTFGYSRDDAEGKFLRHYIDTGILENDPFLSLDTEGVGQLISMGVEKGRRVKPSMEIGICGEHGGDPKSIQFCHEIGLDYVSASPFRVPVARLSAAQAAINTV